MCLSPRVTKLVVQRMLWCWLFVGAWVFATVTGSFAQDSAPKSVSRSGGGGETWTSVKQMEVAAAKGNPQLGEALGWLIGAHQRGDESGVELQLREKPGRSRQVELIAAGEKRAAEIDRELTQPPVTRFLPEPIMLVCTDTMSEKPACPPDVKARLSEQPEFAAHTNRRRPATRGGIRA